MTGWRAATLLVSIGLCAAGCATRAPVSEPVPPQRAPVAPLAPAAKAPLHAEFEREQRARALALEQQGRWSESVLAWEVLSVLEPAYPEYAERLAALRQRIAGLAAERVQRAAAARRRGEIDVAAHLYLSALAIEPQHEAAAQALRAIESERVRRQHLGKPTRTALARRSSPQPAPSARAPVPAQGAQSGEGNELEHAAMLITQGELDDAISLLEQRHAAQRRDAAARLLLADAYYRKGESLAVQNPADAVALLKKSLLLDARHQRAAARLKLLEQPPAGGAPGKSQARPAANQAAL